MVGLITASPGIVLGYSQGWAHVQGRVDGCRGEGGWCQKVLECLHLMISAPLELFTFARGGRCPAHACCELAPAVACTSSPSSAPGCLHLALQTAASAVVGLFLGHLLFFASQPEAGPGERKQPGKYLHALFSLLPVQASPVGPLCVSGCSNY